VTSLTIDGPVSGRNRSKQRNWGALGTGSDSSASILVVDADEDELERTSNVLRQSGYVVLGTSDGEDALEMALRERPSAVILEVDLPELCGYELCRALRAEFGEDLPIVFASGIRKESFDRVAGLLLGADDYLAKPFSADELLTRVRKLINRSPDSISGALQTLTSREQEVLRLLARGLSQKQIAARLYISGNTVKSHTDHIFAKLRVRSRAELIALAHGNKFMGGLIVLVGQLVGNQSLLDQCCAGPI
jgi:DNA-binding NarL/FixJ family response regulator